MNEKSLPQITPIEHASLYIEWPDATLLIDPTDAAALSKDAHLVLVTDIHHDHLNAEALEKALQSATMLIAPQAVADELPDSLQSNITILGNGESTTHNGIT